MSTFSLILHVTAAVILVGPQLLMFYAVVPATWFIENDEQLKRQVLSTIARRFGMLAGISVVILLATGIHLYFQVPAEIRTGTEYPFAGIFFMKMVLFGILLLLIGLHSFRFSRRISRLSDEVIARRGDPDKLNSARMRSFSFSILIMVVSFLILWLGVALGNHEYSWSIQM